VAFNSIVCSFSCLVQWDWDELSASEVAQLPR